MSVDVLSGEPNEQYWDMYLLACRAEGVQPDLSDYKVWLQEQDFDNAFVDWDEVDG